MRKYKQGKYTPINKKKYKGDWTNIVYRSGWEYQYFKMLDRNPNILKWGSETVVIPYVSPIDGKYHRYFMDIEMTYKTKTGTIERALIEIKPYDQTQPPKPQKRKTQKWLEKQRTYVVNMAKWEATKKFCKKRKLKFGIYTERGMIYV